MVVDFFLVLMEVRGEYDNFFNTYKGKICYNGIYIY